MNTQKEMPLAESIDTTLLIEGCCNNDSKAQRSLYYRYYPVLMAVCTRYSKDEGEAEQLVHDSFLKVFGKIDSYKHEGSFEGWMKKITVNTCLDNYKKRKTFSGLTEGSTIYDDNVDFHTREYVTNDVFKKLSVEGILRLVERLPDKEKIVFKLHVLDGYTHEDISALTGIKTNHCYWLLHQGRKHLQTLLNTSAQ